jgi:hypothetical protein
MKFLVHILLTILISFMLQYFLPWWTMAIGSLVIAYLVGNNGFTSFAAGFIAVGLLWLGMALFIDWITDSVLTEKLNRLLPMNSFLLTTLIGGLVGGLSSLTGALLRSKY